MNVYENDLFFISFWIFVLFMSNVVVYYIYEIIIYICIDMSICYIDIYEYI